MTDRAVIWNRVAAEHPYFTAAHDVTNNWPAIEEIVLGGSLTWRRAHELFTPGPGKTVLDIGANAGIYSAYCGARGAEVYAFEPGKYSYENLSWMVRESRLQALVHPIKAAVGDYPGLARTVEHEHKPEGRAPYYNGGLQVDGVKWGEADVAKAEVVPVLTLDSILASIPDKQIDCIKIDTEGSEVDIIWGIGPRNFKRIEFMYIELHEWIGVTGYNSLLSRLRTFCNVEGYVNPQTNTFEALYVTRRKDAST